MFVSWAFVVADGFGGGGNRHGSHARGVWEVGRTVAVDGRYLHGRHQHDQSCCCPSCCRCRAPEQPCNEGWRKHLARNSIMPWSVRIFSGLCVCMCDDTRWVMAERVRWSSHAKNGDLGRKQEGLSKLMPPCPTRIRIKMPAGQPLRGVMESTHWLLWKIRSVCCCTLPCLPPY